MFFSSPLASFTNSDGVTQSVGSVVRRGAGVGCFLAQADTAAHTSNLLGVRLTNVSPGAGGLIGSLNDGMLVRLDGAAAAGDSIYLSAAVAGSGVNVAPVLQILLGVAYYTFIIAGQWYANVVMPSTGVGSPSGASPGYFTPTNPSQIAGAAFKMLGLGSTIHLTPARTGKVRLTLSYGGIAVGTGATGSTKIAYGSGTAPLNGAAATGTVVGGTYTVGGTAAASSTETVITRSVIVQGLTVGTSYWFDVQANCSMGTSAGVTKVEATLEELPY